MIEIMRFRLLPGADATGFEAADASKSAQGGDPAVDTLLAYVEGTTVRTDRYLTFD